jgi:hypothetical protein
MNELQDVIKGSLLLSAVINTLQDTDHEHAVLAKKVIESVLYGTLNEYEKLHGQDNLTAFLSSLPGVELQSGSGDPA